MISSVKTLGERIINRKAIGSPVLSNVDIFFDPPTRRHNIFDLRSKSSEASSSVSTTKTMSNSELTLEDETQLGQKHSMMRLNSSHTCQLPPERRQIVGAQICKPLSYDQLYENHPFCNMAHMCMNIPLTHRSSTRGVPCSNARGPLIISPYELNYGPATSLRSSSKLLSAKCICTPNSDISSSPELPPVLELHKHPAAVTFPDGICCVIMPHPNRAGILQSLEPSAPSSNSASSLPIFTHRKQAKWTHEVGMKSVEGQKLGMADDTLI